MRTFLRLLPLVLAGACGHGLRARTAAAPAQPSAHVVDSGAVVRARLPDGTAVVGRVLVPFRPESPTLVLCTATGQAACAVAAGSEVRRVPVAALRAAAVRGRLGGNGALIGLYLSMLVGGLAYHDESGAGFGLGGLAGLGLGASVGGRVTGWVPLFPCGPHGQCLWRGAWPPRGR